MSVAAPRGQKRGPTVLVTDTREVRPPTRPAIQRPGTRLISVDNVLQYASEIPSGQRRERPSSSSSGDQMHQQQQRGMRMHHNRTPSGRHPLDPKLAGRNVQNLAGGSYPPLTMHLPARSSKTSEKLVLLPETTEEAEEKDADDFEEEEEAAGPPQDEELNRRRLKLTRGKSQAERLPKSQRNTTSTPLARVTAYCTAQSYKLRSTATFVRDHHGAKTKLYDDCLYCVYQLPLLGGNEGYRVRSSPVVKMAGGRSVLDEQIEANEQRQYRDDWRGESEEYSVVGNEFASGIASSPPTAMHSQSGMGVEMMMDEAAVLQEQHQQQQQFHSTTSTSGGETIPISPEWPHPSPPQAGLPDPNLEHERRESSDSSNPFSFASPQPASISPNATSVAELFVFSYGVAVLWNFTSNQEKDLLADLTFSSVVSSLPSSTTSTTGTTTGNGKAVSPKDAAPTPALPLMTRPLDESDFETEEFHFQYDSSIEKPRIFNDMITLRTSDHMIKLAMSNAIAQSTKLSFFEERMQRTMTEAQYVPRRLALEGRLGMSRKEVVGLVGRLFEGRVDVNLSSNMLDTPNFFWDAEPTLHPLYAAVREYLEIKPRIQVLNERCRVFLDLAEILSDSIADVKMTRITWIIIVLIVLSILVTCTEVFLRFGILASEKANEGKRNGGTALLGIGLDMGVAGMREGSFGGVV